MHVKRSGFSSFLSKFSNFMFFLQPWLVKLLATFTAQVQKNYKNINIKKLIFLRCGQMCMTEDKLKIVRCAKSMPFLSVEKTG